MNYTLTLHPNVQPHPKLHLFKTPSSLNSSMSSTKVGSKLFQQMKPNDPNFPKTQALTSLHEPPPIFCQSKYPCPTGFHVEMFRDF